MFKQIILIICLVLGLFARLYKINNPIADWHSHRQADTAAVSNLLYLKQSSFLKPRYYDMSNIQSGHANPQGYRFVELPIYNQISASLNTFIKNIDLSSRYVSIFFSLFSGLLIFAILIRWTKNYYLSIFGLLFFLLNPYSVYYSRSILPEPTAIFFMLLSLYFFPKQLYFAAIALAVSILIKPYTALLLFPLFAYQSYEHKLLNIKKIFPLIIFFTISFLPFYLWRQHIKIHPEGIPVSDWLFNEGNMRLKPVWFRWLFFERIGKLILGAFGLIPFYLGFAYKKNKIQIYNICLTLGIILYFIVIARGNIQHDYYQFLTIPFISIIVGCGVYYMFKFLFTYSLINLFANLLICSFALLFSYFQVKDYYAINNPVIVQAGQKVQELLPSNAYVIAPYNGDTSFLYQTKRFGYPIELYDKLPNLPNLYLVSTSYNDYTAKIKKDGTTIFQNEKFIIIKINNE